MTSHGIWPEKPRGIRAMQALGHNLARARRHVTLYMHNREMVLGVHYNELKRNYVAKRTILLEERFNDMYSDMMLNMYSIMKGKGISFAELSCITGISESHLYRVLRGNSQIKFDNFCKIIVALDIEPQDIFPKEMQKRQERTEYGEYFEYIVKDMDDMEKEFLLQCTERYALYHEQKQGMGAVPSGKGTGGGRMEAYGNDQSIQMGGTGIWERH